MKKTNKISVILGIFIIMLLVVAWVVDVEAYGKKIGKKYKYEGNIIKIKVHPPEPWIKDPLGIHQNYHVKVIVFNKTTGKKKKYTIALFDPKNPSQLNPELEKKLKELMGPYNIKSAINKIKKKYVKTKCSARKISVKPGGFATNISAQFLENLTEIKAIVYDPYTKELIDLLRN